MTLTLAAARKLAVARRLAVQAGGDPATEAKTAATAPTVRDLAARYLEEHAAKKSASTLRNAEGRNPSAGLREGYVAERAAPSRRGAHGR